MSREAESSALCDEYLNCLALAPEQRARIARACAGAADAREAMTRLHAALAEGHVDPDSFATASPADFAAGAAVRLSAGRQPSLTIEWQAP